MKWVWIPHDGPGTIINIDDTADTYSALRECVGGGIEIVTPFEGMSITGFCHGEARNLRSPFNDNASCLLGNRYGYSMVGDFVLVDADQYGNTIGLSEEALDLIKSEFNEWGDDPNPIEDNEWTLADMVAERDERRTDDMDGWGV